MQKRIHDLTTKGTAVIPTRGPAITEKPTYSTAWTGYKVDLYERGLVKPFWTLREIEEYCRAFGSHLFDADSKRFFASRISDRVYSGPGGHFFVSSERCTMGNPGDYARLYTVRQFNPEGALDGCPKSLIDEGPGCTFQQFKSSHGAHNRAEALAAGKVTP